MKIDKLYYNQTKEMLAALNRSMEEAEPLADVELAARGMFAHSEAARLGELAASMIEEKQKVIDQHKVERFKELVQKADDLATTLGLNFHVRTRNGYQGVIRLVGQHLIIDATWDSGEREALAQMIAQSSDMWMDIIELDGEQVLQIEMCYDLSVVR